MALREIGIASYHRRDWMGERGSELLDWIEAPPGDRWIRCGLPSFACQEVSYGELARRVRVAAAALGRAGVRRDDRVVLIASHSHALLAGLFGSLRAGATVSLVAPPRAFGDREAYRAHLRGVLAAAAPRLVLTQIPVEEARELAGDVPVLALDGIAAGDDDPGQAAAAPSDLAMLQFTSGSSGQARAVAISRRALAANVAAIHRWLAWTGDDGAAFWVPPYHDMGLIGGVYAPLAAGGNLWHLAPEQFIRRPIEYLRCLGRGGARLSAMPAFGLEYLTRRLTPEHLDGLDLSGVKAIVVGAELIDHEALARCERLLARAGLRPASLLPAYGLAETTLAVTGCRPGQAWTVRAPAGGGPGVVGCGQPLDDLEVEVVDATGTPVPDGTVGELVVRGPSLGSGYHPADVASASLTRFDGSRLVTGDACFRLGGEIFPVGRLGDSLKIRGQTIFAELLEAELHRRGHRREHHAILLGHIDGQPRVVWVAERLPDGEPVATLATLTRLVEGAHVSLVRVRAGTIPRTSSGKPRRRTLWHEVIHESQESHRQEDLDP